MLSTDRFVRLWSTHSGSCWISQRERLVWKVFGRCVLNRGRFEDKLLRDVKLLWRVVRRWYDWKKWHGEQLNFKLDWDQATIRFTGTQNFSLHAVARQFRISYYDDYSEKIAVQTAQDGIPRRVARVDELMTLRHRRTLSR